MDEKLTLRIFGWGLSVRIFSMFVLSGVSLPH
jgi:hypothetical protein